jgi:uncharacterized protein (DUF2267 family)
MSGYYDNYAAKSNQLLHELAFELGNEYDTPRAARVLRSTLHTFRNCLSTEESLQFIAQLPLIIKGVYVDGWKINRRERIRTWEEFMQDIVDADGMPAEHDFVDTATSVKAVAAVFKVLRRYVSEGEMSDILDQLPQKIRQFLIVLLEGSM